MLLGGVCGILGFGNVGVATARLEFKLATATLTPCLEFFGNELSELTMTFAGIARVPITLT